MANIQNKLKSQRGSGDSGTIILLFVVCSFLSIALIAINWMGSVREERLARDIANLNKRNSKEINVERQPFGYDIVYHKSLFGYRVER